MFVQWTFDNCTIKTKERFRAYWQKKQNRLERLLSTVSTWPQNLRLCAYHHVQQVPQYEVRGVLNLPGRSIAVQFSDSDVMAVLDGLADKLVATVKKHKEQSLKSARQARKQRIAEDLSDVQVLLTGDEKANRKKSFFSTLRPLLKYVERYVQSELKIYEMEEQISQGHVAAADIVDETVLLAWDTFSRRPVDLPLEFWLIRLAQDVLCRVKSESQFVSLDQSLSFAEIDARVEPDWFEQILGYEDEYTLAELVPEYEETEDWEQLDTIGRNLYFYNALMEFPAFQRQAYLLYVLEEYSSQEISQIQDRSIVEVEKDIVRGHSTMRDYMHELKLIRPKAYQDDARMVLR